MLSIDVRDDWIFLPASKNFQDIRCREFLTLSFVPHVSFPSLLIFRSTESRGYESPNSFLSRNVREDGGFDAATPSVSAFQVFSASGLFDGSKSELIVLVCFTHVDCFKASTFYSDDWICWPASKIFQVACLSCSVLSIYLADVRPR